MIREFLFRCSNSFVYLIFQRSMGVQIRGEIVPCIAHPEGKGRFHERSISIALQMSSVKNQTENTTSVIQTKIIPRKDTESSTLGKISFIDPRKKVGLPDDRGRTSHTCRIFEGVRRHTWEIFPPVFRRTWPGSPTQLGFRDLPEGR